MKNIKIIKQKGQALLELSIFGALFLVFLGVLISYGLKYNYQQQTAQKTFRKALYYSNLRRYHDEDLPERGSISYLHIEDRHVPDPTETFALGSVTPSQSSASLVRDYQMYKTADYVDELPVLAIDIKGLQGGCPGSELSPAGSAKPCLYLTAGFAYWFLGAPEACDDDDNEGLCECSSRNNKLKKYNYIFGEANIVKLKGSNNVRWNPGKDDDEEWNGLIKLIDSCEGEILNYGTCSRQCKLITDPAFCQRACEREGYSADCAGICSRQIESPWYCAKLDQLFFFARDFTSEEFKNMGIRPDQTTLRTRENNALRKRENANRIVTNETLDWSQVTKRMIIFRPYGNTSGNVDSREIKSGVRKQKTSRWRTPW